MSFIQQTLKCPCGKYMNVALGTFGASWPDTCIHCQRMEIFEVVSEDWRADDYGNLKQDVN